MPIALFRVDERLIHGQVTVAWGSHLSPARYVVVDDLLAGSDWEQELYRLGVPPGTEVEFTTVAEARRRLAEWKGSHRVAVLLTRSLPQMEALGAEGGLAGEVVNLGGIHDAPGRKGVLPYLFLDARGREAIRELLSAGAEVRAQDLPGSTPVSARSLLGG